jgi:predicted site-specific integrase-resolvase
MSLLTQAFLLEKYGPRLNVDQMAEVLQMARQTINNQMSDGSFPVPTYRANGRSFADYRDLAKHLDECREAVGAS